MRLFLLLAFAGGFAMTANSEVKSVNDLVGTYTADILDDYFRAYTTNPVFSAGEEADEVIISNLFPEPLGETSFSAFLDVEKQVLVIPNKQDLDPEGNYQLWITEWANLEFSYPESYEIEILENGDIDFKNYYTSLSIWSRQETEEVGRDQFIVAYYDTVCYPDEVGGDIPSAVDNLNADDNLPVYYYDLRGCRLTDPSKGSIVIRKEGDKITKQIMK